MAGSKDISKEHNYGADWGDFVSFVKDMRKKATAYGVDLLLIDTGDLHDGAGLSDATKVNGNISNAVFENVDYDVLTIGNHELYLTNIAYETFTQFSKFYGEKYVTSNVQILNNATGKFEYIGQKYRYFTTPLGLRIMAFGVLYDFTGNTNYTQVTTAANLTKEQWFIDAVNTPQPVDLFLLIGHNPVRPSDSESTLAIVQKAIRKARPNTPIQVFVPSGLNRVAIAKTLGWLSMSGIQSATYKGKMNPAGVPNPTQKAINITASATVVPASQISDGQVQSSKGLLYFRRYLDWNRLTFEFHAAGSQASTFDVARGPHVSAQITQDRKALNLSTLFGCAPQTYCITCAPILSNGSIYSLVQVALAAEVVNKSRAAIPRYIIVNTGGIRFDLVQGPFTYDDSFIVSPFTDSFLYIPQVPYAEASQVLDTLNALPSSKKRSLEALEYTPDFNGADGCYDTPYLLADAESRLYARESDSMTRRAAPALTPGYVTSDDFGTDGDDTPHSKIPNYDLPVYVQGNASFPATGKPTSVDLVFLDYVESDVLTALSSLGLNYTESQILQYLAKNFTTNSFLPLYTQHFWSKGPVCPVGQGVQ